VTSVSGVSSENQAVNSFSLQSRRLCGLLTISIYATYILERAEEKGTLIVNKPQSLRDCNEKLFTRAGSAAC
jgi:glutathione synthase/RimK-type ligase-like ATP-grasp enzyme